MWPPLLFAACVGPVEPAPAAAHIALVLAVHVEGLFDDHPAHVDALRELLAEAEENGVPVTLEPSTEFLADERAFGGSVLAEAQAAGHDLSVHASVYAHEASYREAAAHLQTLLNDERALGVLPEAHGSGLCSRQDWVALAAEAGFLGASGIVAYCLRSLPELPEAYAQYAACEDPRACHERVPFALADRIRPWRAASGADWLDASDTGVWLLPAAANYPCALEHETDPSAESCPITPEDIPAVGRVLEAALAEPADGTPRVFVITWSFGSMTNRHQMGDLFRMLERRVDDGRAEWTTLGALLDTLE